MLKPFGLSLLADRLAVPCMILHRFLMCALAIALLWRKVAILESGNQALLRNKLDSSSGAATAPDDNQL